MELLEKMSQCYSPSGHENKIRDIIKNEINEYFDEVIVDAMGNLIMHKKGNGKKLMLASHMDEIGVIVTFIDENGFLRFSNVGGVAPMNCIARQVCFENGVVGIISYENRTKGDKLNNMYIDIGAKNREEAENKVSIGDMAVFCGSFTIMGSKVAGKALDDRAGCYTLVQAVKKAKSSANDLYVVFTAQEELGLRGAKTAAYRINPDLGIAIDVSNVGDTPESAKRHIVLGNGPAIKVKDASFVINPVAREYMIKCAKESEIPYQIEAADVGGTDAGAINLVHSGVPVGTITIPTRYIHSPSEVVDIDDVNNTIKLLIKMIETEV